ncbi:MAG: nitrilase-related carbon-nitrogen hydrolase [Halapricum sp.]
MKLALAQIEIEPAATDSNLGRAIDAVERAAADGADLVVLPELFTVGYFSFDAYARSAESLAGPTLERIRAVAAAENVAVLAGTVVEELEATATETDLAVPSEEGLANTAVLFDADGQRRLVYRKHHLFGYDSAEEELLTPGERLPVAELSELTIGVTTCYDLRFPELYRNLVADGAELIVVPSAWPYPRVEHWQLLPRARAVENLAYVAAANGVGRFAEAELLGRSTVYDPWGTTLSSSGDESALVSAKADPERIAEVRSEFPALADRR